MKRKDLSEAAEARDKAVSSELETEHNETISSSSYITFSKSAKSLNNKIVNLLYDQNKSKAELSCKNILQPLLKPVSSDTSELLKLLLQTKIENNQCKDIK